MLLGAKADVNATMNDGVSPLQRAADKGHATVVTQLLRAGAPRTVQKGRLGRAVAGRHRLPQRGGGLGATRGRAQRCRFFAATIRPLALVLVPKDAKMPSPKTTSCPPNCVCTCILAQARVSVTARPTASRRCGWRPRRGGPRWSRCCSTPRPRSMRCSATAAREHRRGGGQARPGRLGGGGMAGHAWLLGPHRKAWGCPAQRRGIGAHRRQKKPKATDFAATDHAHTVTHTRTHVRRLPASRRELQGPRRRRAAAAVAPQDGQKAVLVGRELATSSS